MHVSTFIYSTNWGLCIQKSRCKFIQNRILWHRPRPTDYNASRINVLSKTALKCWMNFAYRPNTESAIDVCVAWHSRINNYRLREFFLLFVFSSELESNSNLNRKGEYRATQLNWTELTRFAFWQTGQWASMMSPLVIGWRVREHSHVGHRRR